jgi:hypothetical protein
MLFPLLEELWMGPLNYVFMLESWIGLGIESLFPIMLGFASEVMTPQFLSEPGVTEDQGTGKQNIP